MKTQEDDAWGAPDYADEDLTLPANDEFAFDAEELEGFGEGPPAELTELEEPAFSLPDDAFDTPVAAFAPSNDTGADQPIPRIRIQLFFDRPEIAGLVEQARQDRRLSKAELEVAPGGIDAAIAHCASGVCPDLLILDTTAPPTEVLTKLDRLAEYVEETTKVVILGATNDIVFFRELMRRGVSEYLVPPLQPLQLIRAIAALYVNPEKPFAGRVVAVVGAKGGVGASTIAHNIAWLVAERFQSNTTMVDLDLSFGTGALDFNQDPAQTVAEALLSPDRVDEVFLDRLLMRQTDRLMLFCAPASLEREYDVDAEAFETVIDRVRRSAPFVVLDLPHLWTGWMRQTLIAADDVVLVATPELASLRNAKNMLDRIKSARPLDAPPILVLNMTGVAKRPEIPVKDFGEAIGLEPSTIVPFEPQLFGMASNNGQMIGEMAPQSKTAVALETLAASLCGRQPAPRKKASLLDRLPVLKR